MPGTNVRPLDNQDMEDIMFSKNTLTVLVVLMAMMFAGCASKAKPRVAQVPPPPVQQAPQPVQPTVQPTPVPTQTVTIGQIEPGPVQTQQGQVNVPAPLPSQPPSQLTNDQIKAVIPYIVAKLQSDQPRLTRFNQQLSSVQGATQRPLLEQLLLSYITPEELRNLPVVPQAFAPDQAEIIKSVPNPQDYRELHLGEFPVTSGKPFTQPEDYRDNETSILPHFEKLNLKPQELSSAEAAYKACFEGGTNFRSNSHWQVGECLWTKAGNFPYVEQTTGGFNPRRNAETGVTFNVSCTEHGPNGCADAMVFAVFDPVFGKWYIFYNICRGNPAVPLQRTPQIFQVSRELASCKELLPSVPAFIQPGQPITFNVQANVDANRISNVQWTLNGQPFNGTTLSATVNESQVPRGQRATVKFSALASVVSTAGTPAPLGVESAPVPISCQVTIPNDVPPELPIPACTTSEISPKEINNINQPIHFSIQLQNTGRLFIPTIWMDGREVYRGQPTTAFVGADLINIFTASNVEQRHSFEFRAFDPQTNQELVGMRCPGSAEKTMLIQRPVQCPCIELVGDNQVSPHHPAHLRVCYECNLHEEGYLRFVGTTQPLTHGENLEVTHSMFEMVFGREPRDPESTQVEYVSKDSFGHEVVSAACRKELVFKLDHSHKKLAAAIIIGTLVAGAIIAKEVIDFREKIDHGRPNANANTMFDKKTTARSRFWRFVKPMIIPVDVQQLKGTFRDIKLAYSNK